MLPEHIANLTNKKKLKKFHNISQAIQWLEDHPIYLDPDGHGHFDECFDWMCVEVDPKTKRIRKDTRKNTTARFWLESGPWVSTDYDDKTFWSASHDIRLDTGAWTFEKAVWKLVKLVHKFYGNYKWKDVQDFIVSKLNPDPFHV